MTTPTLSTVLIYTDGACEPNPGAGGWAFILVHPATKTKKEVSGFEKESTNNRMELTAALEALKSLKKPCYVRLFSDSQYLVKGLNEWMPDWLSTGKLNSSPSCKMPNADLWWQIKLQTETHQIEANWVRGHNGHSENERCDQLATQEIHKNLPALIKPPF